MTSLSKDRSPAPRHGCGLTPISNTRWRTSLLTGTESLSKSERPPEVRWSFPIEEVFPSSMDRYFSRIVGALVAWLAFKTMLSGRNRWCNLRFEFFDLNVEFLMLLLFHVFNPLSYPIFRRRKSFTEQFGRRRDGV